VLQRALPHAGPFLCAGACPHASSGGEAENVGPRRLGQAPHAYVPHAPSAAQEARRLRKEELVRAGLVRLAEEGGQRLARPRDDARLDALAPGGPGCLHQPVLERTELAWLADDSDEPERAPPLPAVGDRRRCCDGGRADGAKDATHFTPLIKH
jgi:hypothetical protein